MALSNEDKKDVAGAFGKKAASAVSKATNDSKSRALKAKAYGQGFRKDHERLTKKGQTALDYPQMRTWEKHLVKKGISHKPKNPIAHFK